MFPPLAAISLSKRAPRHLYVVDNLITKNSEAHQFLLKEGRRQVKLAGKSGKFHSRFRYQRAEIGGFNRLQRISLRLIRIPFIAQFALKARPYEVNSGPTAKRARMKQNDRVF
jgi:hypothetical protein